MLRLRNWLFLAVMASFILPPTFAEAKSSGGGHRSSGSSSTKSAAKPKLGKVPSAKVASWDKRNKAKTRAADVRQGRRAVKHRNGTVTPVTK